MSLKNVKAIENEKNARELEITIEKAAFDAAVVRAYKKKVGSIAIPGFRKGKAPKSIIEKMYGADFFYNDALNDVIPDAYDAAAAESGLNIVSAPEFDVVPESFGTDEIIVTAKVYVKPEVESVEYKGLEAELEIVPVKDEDVDNEIERRRKANARTVEVTDRAAQNGDTVTIDYCGSIDGVEFAGGKDEGHKLKLGSGSFIPGFEAQIEGHNVDESFDVNVTFPEDYHAEDLKGKAAVFACKLHKIEYEELPELDDEFAKDVSEFDTFAEYKADIKAKLIERNEKSAQNLVEEKLIDALLAKTTVEIPQAMIDSEAYNEINNFEMRLRQQGMNLEIYMQYTGMTIESLKEQVMPQAERQVKTRLALEKVAELEGVSVTDEDIEAEFTSVSEETGVALDKVKEQVSVEDVKYHLTLKKALEAIRANAVITEKKAD
ncbi:MAG: trigger factor [Clostridia bacterium]|nr:trigger factor [Clostridia bacterium]